VEWHKSTSTPRVHYFFAGPVPIEVYAQPKLDFDVTASASLSVATTVGFSSEGGTSIGVFYDSNAEPRVGHKVVPPSNDVDYTIPTLSGTASFSAGAGVVLSFELGLYGGLLSGTSGLRTGVDLNMEGGVTVVGDVVVPTVNQFDLSLVFEIPLSADVLYGEFTIAPGEPVFEKKLPIITLPSTEIELLTDHQCLLVGSNNAAPVASFALTANPSYPSEAIIDNNVQSSDWYIFSTDGWSIDEAAGASATFKKNWLGNI
jgi:hypothetical protein